MSRVTEGVISALIFVAVGLDLARGEYCFALLGAFIGGLFLGTAISKDNSNG